MALLRWSKEVWNASLEAGQDGTGHKRAFAISDLSKLWDAVPLQPALKRVPGRGPPRVLPGSAGAGTGSGPWSRQASVRDRSWHRAKGPISVARLEAQRLGWVFDGPFRLRNDFNQTICLTSTSPAQVGQLARDA